MTKSGVSGIAGNKDVRTGDAETGIAKIFDKDKVQKEVNAQMQITQAFGSQASKVVGDYATSKLKEADTLLEQAQKESDPERIRQLEEQANELKNQWGDQGTLRLAAHTLIGGLTGGASGAAGAATGTLTAPVVAQKLNEAGIEGPLAQTLTALASTAVGATVGGTAGAGAAFNEVTNNYLSHNENERLKRAKSACAEGNTTECQEKNRLEKLDKDRDERYVQAYDKCRETGKCGELKKADDTMQKDMDWPGSLSKIYESKGDPGAINAKLVDGAWALPPLDKKGTTDPGGFSYGSYQIETKNGTMVDFISYVEKTDPGTYQALQSAGGAEAAKKGQNAFVQTWQNLARDTGFAELQHQFIETKKFESAYNYAQALIPDLKDRSPVLVEIIWSGSVQHGYINKKVIEPAFDSNAKATDTELINSFYDVRSEYAIKLNKPYLLPRYEAERQKALDWLNKSRDQWK